MIIFDYYLFFITNIVAKIKISIKINNKEKKLKEIKHK